MAKTTDIEWCDATLNPWIGCTRVSPACDHCYAARQDAHRKWTPEGWGGPRRRTSATLWKGPEKWNARPFYQCRECGWRGETPSNCPACAGEVTSARRRVFCASLADWLDNEVPIEWLVDLLDLVRRTPELDWLLLSKRIGNWRKRLAEALAYIEGFAGDAYAEHDGAEALASWVGNWLDGTPPAHVWLGATVVTQEEADRDVPKLLAVPARVRFLSIEPMLGPVDLSSVLPVEAVRLIGNPWRRRTKFGEPDAGLHWVICGGESGPKARPMPEEWPRSLAAQCKAAGVPFLMKQMGGVRDKRGALEDLPEDLRVREFPHAA